MTSPPRSANVRPVEWRGVFAGVPTQFDEDETLELGGMETQLERLVDCGVAGVVVLAPLGEDASLSGDEKRAVVQRAVHAVGGRVPVVVGTCEATTRSACDLAADCERLGADGLVVLPTPPCDSNPRETLMHVRSVAASTGLPVMVQAHPAGHGGDGPAGILAALGEIENIEAVAGYAADPSHVPRLTEAAGSRFQVVASVDELLLSSVLHGARGQLGTIVDVFPREAVELAVHEAIERRPTLEAVGRA